jgi:hypothetical protein
MPLDAHDIQDAEKIESLFAEVAMAETGKAFVRAVLERTPPDSIWREQVWEELRKVASLTVLAVRAKNPAA